MNTLVALIKNFNELVQLIIGQAVPVEIQLSKQYPVSLTLSKFIKFLSYLERPQDFDLCQKEWHCSHSNVICYETENGGLCYGVESVTKFIQSRFQGNLVSLNFIT